VSTQDEQKEATAHIDLHDKPGGLHPPFNGGREGEWGDELMNPDSFKLYWPLTGFSGFVQTLLFVFRLFFLFSFVFRSDF
jgi:hypothetical protein